MGLGLLQTRQQQRLQAVGVGGLLGRRQQVQQGHQLVAQALQGSGFGRGGDQPAGQGQGPAQGSGGRPAASGELAAQLALQLQQLQGGGRLQGLDGGQQGAVGGQQQRQGGGEQLGLGLL